MIKLHVDEPAAIPLAVEPSSAVTMTVTEAFIEGGGANIQSNKNATPSSSQVVVTPDAGYDGLAKVTVAAIPPEYIIPSGTKSITANGEDQDVRQYEYVDVNVPGIVPTGTKTITTNGTHDVTNYATASVAVPASAVDSGTKSITQNGNGQDVVGYAAVNVNVPNSYSASDEGKVVQSGALVSQSSQNITENGTYDTTTKNEVVVNVSGGGGITTDELALNAKPTGVVTLGSSVTQIKDYSFAGKPITSISGASVTTIGMNALINTQITEITDAMFPNLGVSTQYGVLLRIPTMTSIVLSGRKIALSSGSYALRDNKALVYARFPNAARDVNASSKGCGSYAFGGCTALILADLGFVNNISANAFNGATKISTIILRNTSVVSLGNVSAFTNTPFKNGGTGGTIYIPKVLYDQLGTGTNDYESASNWSTVNGYGTITWAKIEGSEFE